jgi:hypothetical protein
MPVNPRCLLEGNPEKKCLLGAVSQPRRVYLGKLNLVLFLEPGNDIEIQCGEIIKELHGAF